MKLGILVATCGSFLFELPEDNSNITNDYIIKNMIGWLFHSSNMNEYISSLPIEKYLVLCDGSNMYGEFLEIKKEDLQKLYLSLINSSEKKLIKKRK